MASQQEAMQKALKEMESLPMTPELEKLLRQMIERCDAQLAVYDRGLDYVNSIKPENWAYEDYLEAMRLGGTPNPEQVFERWRWDEMLRGDQIETRQDMLDAISKGQGIFEGYKTQIERLLKKEPAPVKQSQPPTGKGSPGDSVVTRSTPKAAEEPAAEGSRGCGVIAWIILIATILSIVVMVYDRKKDRLMLTMEGHSEAVTSVAFSPDGQYALSGSLDDTLRLWNVDTGETVRVMEGHTDDVKSVAFSPDGQYALSGSVDDTLRLWDVDTGETIRVMEGHTGDVNSVAFSPDGHRALSGSEDLTVRLWDIDSVETILVIDGLEWSVFEVAFFPNGQKAFAAGVDDTHRIWNLETGRKIRGDQYVSIFDMSSAALSLDGLYTLAGWTSGDLQLYNAQTGESVGWMDSPNQGFAAICAVFSPDGNFLLTGSADNVVRLWKISNEKMKRELKGHTGVINDVAFSPDGKYALSASADGTVRLWDLTRGLRAIFG